MYSSCYRSFFEQEGQTPLDLATQDDVRSLLIDAMPQMSVGQSSTPAQSPVSPTSSPQTEVTTTPQSEEAVATQSTFPLSSTGDASSSKLSLQILYCFQCKSSFSLISRFVDFFRISRLIYMQGMVLFNYSAASIRLNPNVS